MHLENGYNKIIMVVAGSYWQIPIVKKIKQMGFKSLVVNLYEDSPAFEFADFSEVADILDIEKCLSIARKYEVGAILSDQADIAMPTIAYIAEQLHLPSLGTKCASLYTNKALMRDFCKTHKLPNPEYKICYSQNDAERFLTELKKSIIIKPLDSNSSRGVFRIDRKPDLIKKFDESMSFTRVEKAVLAERYIEGTEFTVDGIKCRDKHITLAISEKKHYGHNMNIANELFFSNYSQFYDYDKLKSTNNQFIESSNLPDGCLTHAEYKFYDGKFYLIEIGARGGGNLISSDIVPLMSGVDNYEYFINTSLGIANNTISVDEDCKDRCSVLFFFDAPGEGGFVKEVKGFDMLENSKNIITYKLYFSVGDKIDKAANDAARIGFYIAYAETKQELLEIVDQINSCFKILYE